MNKFLRSFGMTLLSSLIHFRRPSVPVPAALSNVAAVMLPMVAGLLTGHVLTGLSITLGAYIVMSADEPGPYLRRLTSIVLATLAGAISTFVGHVVGADSHLLLVVFVVWGFLGGLVVVFGPRATRASMISLILLAISTATPLSWVDALESSLLLVAGGCIQALFSVLVWPWRRSRPERNEVAKVYRNLAKLARGEVQLDRLPPIADTLRHLRKALGSRSVGRSRSVEACYTLLNVADRIRLELVALREYDTDPASLEAYFTEVANVVTRIALILEEDKAGSLAGAESALKTLQSIEVIPRKPQEKTGLLLREQALERQLSAALHHVRWSEGQGGAEALRADLLLSAPLHDVAPMAVLRANFHVTSTAFRHALRMAGLLLLAGVVSRHLHIPHSYWLPMTCAIVLRPEFGTTFTIGLQRIIGTLLGLFLTTAVLVIVPHNLWMILVLMALLCFGYRYLASSNYAVAVASLTGFVVIMLGFHGLAPGPAITDRLFYTVMGSIMTLAIYLLWPTWERGQTWQTLATMLDRYADYLKSLATNAPDHVRLAYRSAASVARSNAMTSLDRLQAEPVKHAKHADIATSIFTAANRAERTAMLYEMVLSDHEDRPCQDETRVFIEAVAHRQKVSAEALRSGGKVPVDAPSLPARQQLLETQLKETSDATLVSALIKINSRLVENTETLAHIIDGIEGGNMAETDFITDKT